MGCSSVRLLHFIEKQGWKGRVVPIERLENLGDAILGRKEQGVIDEGLFRILSDFFSFDPPPELPNIKSIIVVAVPTPPTRLFFHWQGKQLPILIPPTYYCFKSRISQVQAILTGWLAGEGFGTMPPQLPLKTLAVGSGLAEYGRNNITYVPDYGSFHQLVGLFSDWPCEDDLWRAPKAMERCQSCLACRRNCPTGAIPADRFLLQAERCLTFHNEAEGEFPCWIPAAAHHCLVGCMRCQEVCPENEAVRDRFEDRGAFSESETTLFLQGVPLDQLPPETVEKWRSLELTEDYRILGRNLSLLLGNTPLQG